MNSNRRNARGEATLRRILRATVDLIGRYGYDNTTIARIVTATQRPASSIYWYFETKDELIAAALEDSYSKVPRSHRPWGSTFDPDLPLLDQLMSELGPRTVGHRVRAIPAVGHHARVGGKRGHLEGAGAIPSAPSRGADPGPGMVGGGFRLPPEHRRDRPHRRDPVDDHFEPDIP